MSGVLTREHLLRAMEQMDKPQEPAHFMCAGMSNEQVWQLVKVTGGKMRLLMHPD